MIYLHRRGVLLFSMLTLLCAQAHGQWGNFQPKTRISGGIGPLNTWSLNTIALNTLRAIALFALLIAPAHAQWSGFQVKSQVGGQVVPGNVLVDSINTADVASNSATTISLTTHIVGTDTNRALIASLTLQASATAPSVAWGGQAMTLISSVADTNGTGRAYLFGLVAPTSGNLTLTASWTGASEVILAASSFSGVNQSGGSSSFVATTATGASSASSSVNVSSTTGNYTVGVWEGFVNFSTVSATQWYIDTSTPTLSAIASYTPGSTTVAFTETGTGTARPWGFVGVDIIAAPGGSGGGGSTFVATALGGGTTGSTTTVSGTYSGFALTGLAASPPYTGTCTGNATLSGFSKTGTTSGTWSATATTPAAACTGGLTVTSVGGAQTLALSGVSSTAFTSSPVSFTYMATGGNPTGMNCAWSGDGSGLTVSGFVSGASGSGSCTSPASAGTYTMSVTGTGGNTATGTAGNSTAVSVNVSSCPDDDGFTNASAGTANFPTLISAGGYSASINGAHGLGCKVAGVDYVVGVTPGLSLKNPTTQALPAGCSYSSGRVTCSGTVTLSGYDFSLNDTYLSASGNLTLTNNKFSFGPNCNVPQLDLSGSLTMRYNTIDGTAGYGCLLAQGVGSFVVINVGSSGFVVGEYNYFLKVNQDGWDINGGGSGTQPVTLRYNLNYLGSSSGHPDYIQFCGGGASIFSPIIVNHNTVYNDTTSPDVNQPLHIEAQICSGGGHLNNSTVAYNTAIMKGTCNGGSNWPTGCSANYVIACKLDDSSSSNTGFKSYGNYIDWSGAIKALDNEGPCPSPVWGSPSPNWDMKTGTIITTIGP